MGVTGSHLLALPGDTLAGDDAEWMPGKSRTRLAPDLDNGFLMDASVPPTAELGYVHFRASVKSPACTSRTRANWPLLSD